MEKKKIAQVELFGIPIAVGPFEEFIEMIMAMVDAGEGGYVCALNAHMLHEARRSRGFWRAVAKAGVVMPDGMPIAASIRAIRSTHQARIAGMDLLPDLLKRLEGTGRSVYFFGGTDEMLSATDEYMKAHHPDVRVAGMYNPPMTHDIGLLSDIMEERINAAGADIVFVVLGCPKQEKCMAALQGRTNSVLVGIGGALPVMLGMQQRAPEWMRTNGLEWLYRFKQEPKRLFRRYATTNTTFCLSFLREFAQVRMMRPIRSGLSKAFQAMRGKGGKKKQKVVLLCQDRTSDKLVDFLSDRRDKIEVAGIFSDDMHHLTSYPVIGRVRDLEGYVQEHKVDAVFTQIPERTSPFVSRLYRSIRRKYIQLHFVHDSGFERERIPLMGGDSSGLFIESNTQRPAFMTRHLVKRGGDIALSLFGILFLLSWLIPVVGIISWFLRGK